MIETWQVDCSRWEDWLPQLPDGSVDLVLGSPPYESQRTYGIGFDLRGQAWVDWMVALFREALRACRGLVAMVLEGCTRNYRWSATPALLMADLHRAGIHLRKPPIYHRGGIPGGGGPDWWRNDYEFIVCATNGGRLPWSDNVAMGHPVKFAPGGKLSHRTADEQRVNAQLSRRARGEARRAAVEAGHGKVHRAIDSGEWADKETVREWNYVPPAIANPGNVIRCKAGGGHLGGEQYASQNEAPYPERLAEFFVRSFCPPGGLVVDPFTGSGTTGAVAVRWGRRFRGCDVRQSQVDLARQRISEETPTMFPDQTGMGR